MLREDGERFLPWMADPVISYEHLHRYRVAAELARGLRVLDLASGEGYGSALLQRAAHSVLGLDLDHAAVVHASKVYGGPTVRFVQGSITAVPAKPSRFDLVVCFEALEHVADQDGLCREAARLLSPDGLFLVSTPNRPVYSERTGFHNSFHVKELDRSEFAELLARHFRHVRLFGQHVYPVSSIFPIGEAVTTAREFPIARERQGEPFRWVAPGAKEPRYFIGAASQSERVRTGLDSFLTDVSEQLFELQRRAEGVAVEMTRHLKVREDQALALDRELAETKRELADRTHQLSVTRTHLAARTDQAGELDALLRERGQQAQALEAQVAGMEATAAWRLHVRIRRAIRGLRRLLGLSRHDS